VWPIPSSSSSSSNNNNSSRSRAEVLPPQRIPLGKDFKLLPRTDTPSFKSCSFAHLRVQYSVLC